MNKDYLDLAFGKPGVHRWFIKKGDDLVLFGWFSIWNGNCHTGSFTLDTEGLEGLIRVIKEECEVTYDQLLYAYKYGSHKFIDHNGIVERIPRGKFTLDNFHEGLGLTGKGVLVFETEEEFRSKALELI